MTLSDPTDPPSESARHYVVIVHAPSGRRQRSRLYDQQRVLLGRPTGSVEHDRGKLLVEVDNSVSRLQAWLELRDGRLHVERHPQSRTALSFNGNELDKFTLNPGEAFYVGQTAVCYEVDKPSQTGPEEPAGAAAPFEYTVTQGVAGVQRAATANRWLSTLVELPALLQAHGSPGPFLSALCQRLQAALGNLALISAWEVTLPTDSSERPTLFRLDDRTRGDSDAHQPSRRAVRAAFERPDEAIIKVWPAGVRTDSPADFSAPGAEVAWSMYLPIELGADERYLLYAEGRGSRTVPPDQSQLSDTRQVLGLVAGIAKEHLIAARASRLRGQVGQFFSPRLRDLVLGEASAQSRAGGPVVDPLARTTCDATIMFFDLRGFSRATEEFDVSPNESGAGDVTRRVEEYYHILEQVLGMVSACVFDEDGIILQYEGDAALACWGAPTAQPDHCARAVRAARRIVEAIYQMELPFAMDTGRGAPLRCGIGITSGPVVAGRFVARAPATNRTTLDDGSSVTDGEAMVTYTVMGTVVNKAARLEGLTKKFRVPVLVSYRPDEGLSRYVASVIPAGMRQKVDLYELVIPEACGGSGASAEGVEQYEAALASFMQGELDAASAQLRHPSLAAADPVQEFLTGYVIDYKRAGLPPDWDGCLRFDTK